MIVNFRAIWISLLLTSVICLDNDTAYEYEYDNDDYNGTVESAACYITTNICRNVTYDEYGGYSGIARAGYLKLLK